MSDEEKGWEEIVSLPLSDESRAAFRKMIFERAKRSRPIVNVVVPKRERDWTIGFGPRLLQPGERVKIDVQPKCLFRVEKIVSGVDGAALHGLFIGKEEQLGLNGDSISLTVRKTIDTPNVKAADPAMPIVIDVENRSSEPRMIELDIVGKAVL